MRKHDVRKWLHAILDLLPVIVIPVFMIYSHRHTIDSYSITTPKYDTIRMQQNVVNGKPSGVSDITFNNSSHVINDTFDAYSGEWSILFDVSDVTFNLGDKGIITFDFEALSDDLLLNIGWSFGSFDDYGFELEEPTKNYYSIVNENQTTTICNISFDNFYEDTQTFKLSNVQLFNLTQMFGSGNEPSVDEFKSLFPNEYYPVDSNASILYETGTQTYNDTDIGSQFFYCLYNSVDKYFNMGNVFGLNGVYRWFEINIFHAQAPLSVYIVWQVVLYEFVMDLLFLLYGLFMWFIDMVEHIMDKPFKSIK